MLSGIWWQRPSQRALALVSPPHRRDSRETEKPYGSPEKRHVVGPYNDSRGAFSAVTLNDWDERDVEGTPGKPEHVPALRSGPAGLVAPPGFALVQLLPGQMVRLVLRLPKTLRWRPGQHVLLCVPSVHWWQSHPYTIVGADPRSLQPDRRAGSDLTFLIRARNGSGFSATLYKQLMAERARVGEGVPIYVRAQTSMSFGTCARTRWHAYKTVLVFCGGTGISFGATVLEHLCSRIAAREHGRKVGRHAFLPTRVRLVWILQEHVHLAWVAPLLRRCLAMCPPGMVQVEFFVTRPAAALPPVLADELAPPTRPYASITYPRRPSADGTLVDSEDEADADVSSATLRPPRLANLQIPSADESALDFVLFEGDVESPTAAEAVASEAVRKTGRLRRALSRRKSVAYAKPPAAQDEALYPPAPNYSRPMTPQSAAYNQSSVSLDEPAAQRGGLGSRSSSTHGLLAAAAGDDVFLDLSEADRDDLDAMAEFAREGKPSLERIVDDELRRTSGKGPTIVACCGPVGLNVALRTIVADRIRPGRVDIDILAEDFDG